MSAFDAGSEVEVTTVIVQVPGASRFEDGGEGVSARAAGPMAQEAVNNQAPTAVRSLLLWDRRIVNILEYGKTHRIS
jgi:hypothetical protein